MDAESEIKLRGVHPLLAAIMRNAAQIPQPFRVVYGLRTSEAEHEAVVSGHSQTMHSRHLANAEGLACAVDVVALLDGKVSFAAGHEPEVFGAIAEQILAAAAGLGVPLEWGGAPIGAWAPGVASNFRDWGHFQLPGSNIPETNKETSK